MPFTISHAAAVLPLRRLAGSRLPLAALMIGSMSPDFAYFLPFELAWSTHTLFALFWFCLPLGLACWLLFVRVMQRPTLALLPESWRGRFTATPREINPGSVMHAAAGVVLGALTHVVWDSFTHAGTPLHTWLPVLHARIGEIQGTPVHVYWLLQHLSTLLGAAILAAWIIRLPRSAPSSTDLPTLADSVPHRLRVAALLAIFTLAGAMAIAGFVVTAELPFERRLVRFAIDGMAGGGAAWLLVAVWIRSRWRRASAQLAATDGV